ncbi:MAG: MFS transporter [Syntrophales bacterium]|nr:MFS transporter [Syntrophales bacterium]MDD5232517.1 MFS transporter [Syntrophales bacterium]MDD5532369.1 MFS transporter [Syntrophales bacterium]
MNLKVFFSILMGLNLGVIFMNIPPAMDELMLLYGVSYTRISVLLSALLWSHALMQIPAGMMTDHFGTKRTLAASLILMGFGNLVPAFLPDFELAVFGRVATGIGTGLSVASTMKMVAVHAPGGRIGMYQSFFGGFFSLGSIVSFLVIPQLAASGWQWIYVLPGTISFPMLAMLPALGLESEAPKPFSPLGLGRALGLREGWLLGLCHALSFGSMLNLGNWIPSLLAELSREGIAAGFAWGGALVMLTSGIGRLSGGFVLLKVSSFRVVAGSLAILSVLFLGLFLIRSPLPAICLALLASWFASINFGAIFHLAAKATLSDSYATLFGFINFLANLGAILFTLTFGMVKDATGSFTWGFLILALLSSAAFFLNIKELRIK